MIKTIVLLSALASSLGFAANSDDWPNVAKDCGEVFQPPAPPPPPPNFVKRFIACGADFFTARPVHPTVKSIVPGSGFGVGPTFTELFNAGKWQRDFTATGVASTRAFWQTEAKFTASHDKFGENNSARDRFAYDFYARARDLPLMPYYGIGPNTSRSDLVDFRQRDVAAGGEVFNPFSAWFALGGRFETLWADVGGVTDPGRISITSTSNEGTVPGLTSQPNLLHSEIYAEPRRTRGKFQFDYKIGYNFYADHDTGRYSFQRFQIDGTHVFHPTGRNENILTVRDRLSLSNTNGASVVPFYLQETLGGSDINGDAALRGFADYRFRGPDLMLIQVEYDQRIWGPVGLLGFYDTGEVALKASDLSLAEMRHSFGFGFSFWAGNRAVFKAYIGLGSGEGRHSYVGIPSF
ncbi:MAG TPA: hypothetical protein VH639_14695 [Bryobacteraceae bacterium]|jgi:hypothetical protein